MIIFKGKVNYQEKVKNNTTEISFWIRLKLLLWKNWLLRKRNKFRTITEVLWPIFMIYLVVLFHQVGEKQSLPNCHMKAKAMPSAGEILFLQTFFCALNNTCDAEVNASLHAMDSSLVSTLGKALEEAFNLTSSKPKSKKEESSFENKRTDQDKKFFLEIKNWVKDLFVIESLMEAIKKKQHEKLESFINFPHFKNHSTNYTCNNIKYPFFDELRHNGLEESLFGDVRKNGDKTNDLIVLSRIKRKIYLSGILNSVYQMLTKKTDSQKIKAKSFIDDLNIIDYLLCGPNVPKIMAQVNSLIDSGRKKSRQSEEAVDPESSQYIIEEFEWENDTTDFCNQLMRKLESTYSSRVVFRIFKPLVRGKLIYTPDAPVIKRLMTRINESLSHVKMIIDLIKSEREASGKIGDWRLEDLINKYKNEELFLEEIVKTKIGKAFLRHFGDETEDKNDSYFIKRKINKFQNILDETIANWRNLLKNSMENGSNFSSLIPYLECIDYNRLIPVREESAAVKEAMKWLNKERLWGLIVFKNVSLDAEELPSSITYKIRTGIERTSDTNHIRDRIYVQKVRRNVIYDIREITGGFAYLQNMIESELIREFTGRKNVPGIYLKQNPYPCHVHDSFREVVTKTFPMFMVVSWIYIFCMVSKRIVFEKEILFKGTLRIFGVTTTQHWISWFIDAFVPMIFVTCILSVLLVKGGLIPNSNIFVIWLFLSTFVLPTITLSFLVSTFFSKSSLAVAVSGMIYFLLYLPYPPIQNFAELINPYLKIFACLISNVAFGLGCTWIANMEEIGIGAQLDKINFSPVPGNPITMYLIIQMFLIDSVIYLLIAIYFDCVFTTSDFVKQPWYYCITKSYWRSSSVKEKEINSPTIAKSEEKDPRYFESDPEGLRVGIEVVNLTKEFGRSKGKKIAVNNLNINFYESQITSFLGRNGAGKTTTISMMIGLLPITKGTVRIYGIDIKNNPNLAIKDLGICRQENVLLDDLTVEEHFKLFGRLKNPSFEEVSHNMEELLENLQLGHRAKQPVKILSGGMKRKVCIAMAFIGGSRTVFLDEPTAGIDPYSRRSIWELLVKYKKGRTIILTTHFLDEADLLGDRIAIISSGKLQCCGSSMFLRSQLGRGYYLTIEKNIRSDKIKKKTNGSAPSTQAEELFNFIKKTIPDAEFSEEIGSEIVFILPSQRKAEDYNTLFVELDKNKEKFNFSSYGVTDTSLEEIFMKILLEAEKDQEKNFEKANKAQEVLIVEADQIKIPEKKEIKLKGTNAFQKVLNLNKNQMLKEHFFALLIKRFLHHCRNFKIVLIEILLPALFMAVALPLAKTLPAIKEMPPRVIDMSAYSPSNLFYTNEIPENVLLSSYEEVLLGSHGLGTKCVLFPETCSLKAISKGSLIAGNNVEDLKHCYCSSRFFECLKNETLIRPPNAKMSSGDRLFNLTGLNLTNWLITTEFDDSAERMGGISFGYFTALTGMSAKEFLDLFLFKKFVNIIKKFIIDDNIIIDPDIFTLMIMSTSCNKTFGEELFKKRDLADNILIWFNNRGWISSIAMMNGVSNLVLRASLPNGTDPSKYSITLINHPLPITKRQLEDQIEIQGNIELLCALSVIWALSFIPAMYTVYLVEERVSGLKHLQIVSGISRIIYWCTNLIWDLISYSVSIFAIILLYFFFHMTAFIEKESIGCFVTLLYSYGFVNITFAYLISFMFTVPSTAFIFTACWNILTGVMTLLSTFTLTMVPSKDNYNFLHTVFMALPQFCFGKSLINMALEDIRSQALENFGVTSVKNSFAWHLTMKYIIIMLIMGVIFFIATLLVEYNILQRYLFDRQIKKKVRVDSADKEEDEDLKKERERVESGEANNDGDVLILNNLTKYYSKRESAAVDHICVGIKHGECFGLLGLNGAGKTTVFKMLTGYVSPSIGDVTIGGYSIRKNPRQAKLLIGYCPQVNALDPYLTPMEHLSFFCRIKGVTGQKKDLEISSNIERLGLNEHQNKIVKVLSGGNKRKVNTAIALICNPELILLDEPTSGMDVLSRRLLWNCLQDVMLDGRSIVLTSHSMEECQALCTHLAIMVNGKFSCFGSSQHLKNKFNEGYNVTVKLYETEKIQDVMHYFEKNLPQSILVQIHYLQMKYRLNPQTFIGTVFTIMSQAKEKKLIQDYSISQTTLENVFLRLATTAEKAKEPKSRFKFIQNFCCTNFS